MSVAKPLPHDSARLHVTGAARYVDDLPLPASTLHLAFGLSTVAHGDILSMDLSEVRASPGVVAVWTAADLPFANDVSPSVHDEPLLATDRTMPPLSIRFLNQPRQPAALGPRDRRESFRNLRLIERQLFVNGNRSTVKERGATAHCAASVAPSIFVGVMLIRSPSQRT